MGANQQETANLNLCLPGDQSRTLPWGADIKLLSDAFKALDPLIAAAQAAIISLQAAVGASAAYAADTGSANAYAAAYTPAPTLAAGLRISFLAAHANTGASTLAVNGGSAKAITVDGAALAGGEIAASSIVLVEYDGTGFEILSVLASAQSAITSLQASVAALQAATAIAASYAADTGSANAYAVTYSPAPTLAAGLKLWFLAAHANTGASTLAVNSGAAKAITKSGATALAGGEIAAGSINQVVYDGTQFQLVSE